VCMCIYAPERDGATDTHRPSPSCGEGASALSDHSVEDLLLTVTRLPLL
jgi:hypothetical protein